MMRVPCPFPRKCHGVKHVVVNDVQDAEDSVANVGEKDGLDEVFGFVMGPADEEVAIYLADTEGEKVGDRDSISDSGE